MQGDLESQGKYLGEYLFNVALDLATGGLSSKSDEILECGDDFAKHADEYAEVNHSLGVLEETKGAVSKADGDNWLDIIEHADDVPNVDIIGNSKTNVREKLLNTVSNDKLKNCINEMYRPGATTGDGGLADAIRHELTTGELIGGKSHIQKGIERVKNLENIIAKQNLNTIDLEIATNLLNELKSALELGGY